MALILSSAGCVCDIAQSDQFDNVQGESQSLCGPWTVAALKYAGLPGKGALASGAGHENPIDDFAENEYQKYIGPNVTSNQMGSTIENMHQFFHDAGNLHYFDIGAINDSSQQADDNDRIRRAVWAGYPVAVTVHEPSVISKRLGHCPYSWQPALGDLTHIIPVIGIDRDGDFIVGDQANAVESWPQTYLASAIHFHWASVVQLVGPNASKPWLAPIPGNDPRTWQAGFNAQQFGGNMSTLPPGWHDDGTTLTAPNGHKVVLGFRARVLPALLSGEWKPYNQPLGEQYYTQRLEDSNPALGDGDQIIFTEAMLGYPHNPQAPYEHMKNQVIDEYIGVELQTARAQLLKAYTLNQQLQQQIAQLKAQGDSTAIHADMQQIKTISTKY